MRRWISWLVIMHEFLVFSLYGAMASWGDVAVGDFRPTHDHPTRSAIFGLVAAALGIRRDEEEKLAALSDGYNIGIRLDSPGTLLRDYHTAQVPRSGTKRAMREYPTRRDELKAPVHISTILSTREYYCDAASTIYLWDRTEDVPYSLEHLRDALNAPTFVLYLGRKACPLALPLNARVVRGESLAEVFASVPFPGEALLKPLVQLNRKQLAQPDRMVRVYWEGDEDTGIQAVHSGSRHDEPLSRKRWQFGDRIEHYGVIERQEEDHVSEQNQAQA